MSYQAVQEKAVRKTPLIIALPLILIASIFFSILIEWLGIMFIWEAQGSQHAYNMMINEYRYLNDDFKTGGRYSPFEFAKLSLSLLHEYGVNHKDIMRIETWVRSQEPSSSALTQQLKLGLQACLEYIKAAFYTLQTFLMRFSLLLFSLPAVLLFSLVGIVDGLVRRDIRKWSGGRESGLLYHTSKKLILPSVALSWVVYLSLPFSIHPNFIVIPGAIATAMLFATSAGAFKKYL
ncbi:TIGR03747 family integrating conjugative element membrane protein [Motilimonas pumila]|uniref:TIGR03747 family integrating conjugative element membrane protein n=1 Tax=Motilimonas pumila TaxID=2303987 RepID=A0A418YA28_9GAMM|nr:TIGR03747 family integrating conjugative element membrane protein [Motilimonas pumila]RJG38974.1 TIGR03747 family integrating conjugative element membrane protein [Motilimonas pumila]